MKPSAKNELRILLLVPEGKSPPLPKRLIEQLPVALNACASLDELVARIDEGAGAVILAEEYLDHPHSELLARSLNCQPPWSDLPVLLVTARGTDSPLALRAFETFRNLVMLERPLRAPILLSALRSALQARRRQYELRDRLGEARQRRAEVEHSHQIMQALLENIPEGILIVGSAPDYLIRTESKYGIRLAGDNQSSVGQPMGQDVMTRRLRVDVSKRRPSMTELPLYRAVHYGELVVNEEWLLERDDGECVSLLCNAGPIRDREGNLAGAVLSFRDISDRKHAERRLRELNEDLENRVRERTHALLRHREKLRAMATQLGSAEQRERRRLATDLHDYLAQLLVVCRMKLSTATSAAAPPPATAAKDAAMACREEVLRGTLHEMDELLDQSLTYTRTLVSRLSPTILYEAGLLSALRWLAEQFEREGLEVEVQGSEFAAPDDLAIFLYQAVRELLYNVLKHARVKHAYVLVDQRENEIHVEVADTGAGFPPESLLQVPSEEGRFGLFNIRERIEAMGGAFELDSAPGCGAKIVLRLPAETPAQQPRPFWNLETPMLDEDTEPADTMRIVLVDDHSIVRDGLRRVIESDHHFKVVGEAANGEEAIALAHTLSPDLVVMDINMPRMNGIEATRIIKEALPSICIVGLSLEDTNEIRESMKKAGASAFVSKNGPSGEFHQVLREFSALHR